MGDSQNFETAPQGGSTKIIFFWEKVKPGPSPYLFWAKNAFFWPFSMFFFPLKNLRLIFSDFGGVVLLLLEATFFGHHRVATPFWNRPDDI